MKRIFLVSSIAALAVLAACSKSSAVPTTSQDSTSADSQPSASQSTSANQLPPSQKSAVEVVYTDNGFSPKSVDIAVGQSVNFVNLSTSTLWPASAPHPAHTDYPEFDAKKPIEVGQTYSFAFTKIGNWKFHNHLKSTDFGVINVK